MCLFTVVVVVVELFESPDVLVHAWYIIERANVVLRYDPGRAAYESIQ
jgi:hypothetical protein